MAIEFAQKEYFIFGEQFSIAFHSDDWDTFVQTFKEKQGYWDFDLYVWDYSVDNGEDLLAAYDGYMGSAVLTEKEYKELTEIQKKGFFE